MAAALAVQLAEYLLSDAKRAVVRPLIATLQRAASAFFVRQCAHTIKRGLPYLAEKWPNHPTLSAQAAVGAALGHDDTSFASAFDRVVRKAYDAGVAEAESSLGIDHTPIQLRNIKSAQQLRAQVDETTARALRAVIDTAADRGDTLRTLERAIRTLFRAWSQSRAQGIALNEISIAYHRGMLDVANAAELAESDHREARKLIHKYWAAQPGACPICEENEAVGDIPVREEFPSGHDAPPAHPHDRCSLVLIDLSESRPNNLIDFGQIPEAKRKKAIKEFWKSMTPAWKRSLTKAQREAIRAYTRAEGKDFTAIQEFFRQGEGDVRIQRLARQLELTFKAELKQDTTVYRGLRMSDADFREGNWYRNLGATTTSLDPRVAADFAGENGVILQISVPRGVKVSPINGVSAHPEQQEILIRPGTELRIGKKSTIEIGGKSFTLIELRP